MAKGQQRSNREKKKPKQDKKKVVGSLYADRVDRSARQAWPKRWSEKGLVTRIAVHDDKEDRQLGR